MYARKFPKHELGISFSNISGTGLGYLLELDRWNGLRFTFMPFYSGDDPQKNDNLSLIGGIEYHRNIYRDFEHRVYIFGAASIWYFEQHESKIINPNTDFEQEIILFDKDVYHNFGVGFGYMYNLNNVVSFDLNLGIQYQSSSNNSYQNYLERLESGESSFLGLGGGVGILFHL
jgi:hypothetical protein